MQFIDKGIQAVDNIMEYSVLVEKPDSSAYTVLLLDLLKEGNGH